MEKNYYTINMYTRGRVKNAGNCFNYNSYLPPRFVPPKRYTNMTQRTEWTIGNAFLWQCLEISLFCISVNPWGKFITNHL